MKLKQILRYISLFLILLFFTCSPDSEQEEFFDFTEPEISSVSPNNDKTGVDPYQEIEIQFSEDVDKESAEKSFSLSSSGNTEGRFEWDDEKTMKYIPLRGWSIGERYNITIERSLQDKNRNKLQRKFVSKFYIGNDFDHPYITDVTNNPYVQQNDIILTIYFSKEMDFNSLTNAVSFSPSFSYRMELNDGSGGNTPNTILTITLNEDLSTMTEYTMTISTDAKSDSGLSILRNYTYDFAMYYDTEKPEIISFYLGTVNELDATINTAPLRVINPETPVFPDPNDISAKDESIVIAFNENMDRSSVENAFNIDPEITGRFYWKRDPALDPAADILIFTPDTGFEQSTIYKLFIESTAKDLTGNQLDIKSDNYNLRLATYPIKVLQVVFNPMVALHELRIPDPIVEDYFLSSNDIIEGVHISTIDSLTYDGNLNIRIYFADGGFDTLQIDEIEPASLYSSIKITHQMGSQDGDPLIVGYNIDTVNDYIEVEALDFEQNPDDPFYYDNMYKLTITGGTNGVKDIYGNYMENTVIIYFKVDERYWP